MTDPAAPRPETLFMPGANMYGCMPCPKCGGEYRVPYGKNPKRPDDPFAGKIVCDDCGYRVEYVDDEA